MAASIRRFGWRQPVVAKRSGEVIAGNTRLKAAEKLGLEEVPVVWFEGAEIEATAFAIADNRTSEFAEWDQAGLGALLAELKAEDALEGVGFDVSEVDALLAELGAAEARELEDPGPEEPPETPVTKAGDLWLLGDHRILCADSTLPETFERLMDGKQARLLATDPPYLVDYTDKDPKDASRPTTGGRRQWDKFEGKEAGVAFFDAFLKVCLPHVHEDAAIYQWHATRRQALVEQAWEQNGLLVHQTIVWAKGRGVFGRSFFQWRHEPCFMGWKQGHMPPKDRRPPPNHTTVWEIDQAGEERPDHPTPKPLEVFTRPQEYHLKPGEIALEPFSGSGSQLIAAEKTRRRCFAVEQAPGYVDVAVKRWQKATGREAVLEATGQTFDQVARSKAEEAA